MPNTHQLNVGTQKNRRTANQEQSTVAQRDNVVQAGRHTRENTRPPVQPMREKGKRVGQGARRLPNAPRPKRAATRKVQTKQRVAITRNAQQVQAAKQR